MKKQWACSWLLSLWAVALAAQKSQEITVPTEPDPEGGSMALLCCTPSDLSRSREICSYEWKRKAAPGKLNVSVKLLCAELKENATAIALDRVWHVFPKNGPRRMVFGINCDTSIGWPLEEPAVLDPTPPPPAPANTPVPAANTPPPQATVSGDKGGQEKTEKVNKRLKEVEKSLAEQQKSLQNLKEELEKRSTADRRELEKKMEALQRDLQDKLRTLGEAQKNSCYRVNDIYKGRAEVTVAVAGSVLRFLEVKPHEAAVSIGLSEAKAGELLAAVQAQSSITIFPHIYLAVPEAVREVTPFFLQDRLIDPTLYSRLTGGKDAGRVSYEEVTRFIEDLNSRCTGLAKFALPTEEQFVAAAHSLYEPLLNGLKPCGVLRQEDLRSDVTELLGTSWQLTRSLCETFSDHPKATCPPESSWIRKGGAGSSNPLECMPEYRSPAPFDVHQKETSFRLALVQ